jgi:hypothetical protein
MRNSVQTTLRFVGDWPWWCALLLAALMVAAVFWVYRRELSGQRALWRWVVSGLRALAVAMVALMLSGPVLRHRKVLGEICRLLVFVDDSKSMALQDSSMSAARKVAVLQSLGVPVSERLNCELAGAAAHLARIRFDLAAQSKPSSKEWAVFAKGLADLKVLCGETAALIAAHDVGGGTRTERFRRDLLAPLSEINEGELQEGGASERLAAELRELCAKAVQWEEECGAWFTEEAVAEGGTALEETLKLFDAMTRAERVRMMLLGSESSGLLARLAESHEVEVYGVHDSEAVSWWRAPLEESRPPTQLPVPSGSFTDLSTGMRAVVGEKKAARTAVVLLSDGQHNDGPPPEDLAEVLEARKIPLFTVGLGSTNRPRDVALLKTDFPQTVYFQDRVRGTVTLKQDVPPGTPFKLWVRHGERVVMEKMLRADEAQVRQVEVDFAVAEPVADTLRGEVAGLQWSGVPLHLEAGVSDVAGDSEASNNTGVFRLRAVTQKRRILIVDGRSRWETRYLRNVFERDEQWEVNAVVGGATSGRQGFLRGAGEEQFPGQAADLDSYDLIVFGEVPRKLWNGDQDLEWIRDFVGVRGGGAILLDGSREFLREYLGGPMGGLLPVEWTAPAMRGSDIRLELPAQQAGRTALSLAPERAQNADVWARFMGPRWVAGVKTLPGSEVWVEAVQSGSRAPAVVCRAFGAGKVVYHGFDETWRWRQEFADRYHTAYWRQLADAVAETPFAVRDRFVSLDAGGLTYRPSESAQIRVRLRDGGGRPVKDAKVDAVLYKNGLRVSVIPMKADTGKGGLFTAGTGPLDPGDYEVAVEAAAIPSAENKARTGFRVETRQTGEMSMLNLNEELLRTMAVRSGGEYLREEDIGRLEGMLAPLSEGRVIELETALWQSYYWLLPLVLFLGAEWWLRKRLGLL